MDDKEKIEEAIRQIDKHIEEIRSFKFKFLNGSLDDILSHITNKIDKPFNSCGSYKYESLGVHLFSKVEGNNETIQGLPIIELLNQLKKKNIYSINDMTAKQ